MCTNENKINKRIYFNDKLAMPYHNNSTQNICPRNIIIPKNHVYKNLKKKKVSL